MSCEANKALVAVFSPSGGAPDGAKCGTSPTVGLCLKWSAGSLSHGEVRVKAILQLRPPAYTPQKEFGPSVPLFAFNER